MANAPYHHGDLRTAILDAAEETLAEKSLDAVSMRELARRAGVSSGAPYHHFGDRTGLIGAICQRGFTRLGDALSSSRNRGMKVLIDAYLRFARKNQALYQLMFSPEATDGTLADALHPYAGPVFALLEEAIDRERNGGQNCREDLAAVSVWCFMHGVASLSAASPLNAKVGRRKLNDFAHKTVLKLVARKN